jgi:hypothetical protein
VARVEQGRQTARVDRVERGFRTARRPGPSGGVCAHAGLCVDQGGTARPRRGTMEIVNTWSASAQKPDRSLQSGAAFR